MGLHLRSSRFAITVGVAVAAMAVMTASSAHAFTYDVLNSVALPTPLSPNVVPGVGTFTFGTTTSISGSFAINPFERAFNNGTVAGFDSPSLPSQVPLIWRNITGATINQGTVTQAANVLNLHPGSGGLFTVLRYTAQTAGVYSVSGQFTALDSTSTTVAVIINGGAISGFSGNVNNGTVNPAPGTAPAPFNLSSFALAAGGTIDFVVGPGAGNSFLNDSTGLQATITGPNPVVVPEAGTAALLGFGALVPGALLIARRRRKV
jgi:hypothetical protein